MVSGDTEPLGFATGKSLITLITSQILPDRSGSIDAIELRALFVYCCASLPIPHALPIRHDALALAVCPLGCVASISTHTGSMGGGRGWRGNGEGEGRKREDMEREKKAGDGG